MFKYALIGQKFTLIYVWKSSQKHIHSSSKKGSVTYCTCSAVNSKTKAGIKLKEATSSCPVFAKGYEESCIIKFRGFNPTCQQQPKHSSPVPKRLAANMAASTEGRLGSVANVKAHRFIRYNALYFYPAPL